MAAKQKSKKASETQPLRDIKSIGVIKGEFKDPTKERKFTSMAIGKDGSIYAADGLNRVIVVFTTEGEYVRQFKVEDVGISIGGMAVTDDGNLVVTNFQNHRVSIYSSTGVKKVDFQPEGAFKGPGGVAINKDGQIFISECKGNIISVFNKDGVFMYKFGVHGSDPGQFNWPLLMCIGPDDFLYISDHQNNRVQVFEQNGTHVRVFGKGKVSRPIGIWPTNEGYLVVVSRDPHKICFFTANGHLSHEIKDAGLNYPYGVAVDTKSNIFVADTNNYRVLKF